MRDKILVVDDMEINREILYGIFESDYEVLLAADGRQAIELIQHVNKELSLILLDIVMPDVDGFEVMEFLKEKELLEHIPVVMITSDTSYESKRRGVCDGRVGFCQQAV